MMRNETKKSTKAVVEFREGHLIRLLWYSDAIADTLEFFSANVFSGERKKFMN